MYRKRGREKTIKGTSIRIGERKESWWMILLTCLV